MVRLKDQISRTVQEFIKDEYEVSLERGVGGGGRDAGVTLAQ